jgi:hypothetical protein
MGHRAHPESGSQTFANGSCGQIFKIGGRRSIIATRKRADFLRKPHDCGRLDVACPLKLCRMRMDWPLTSFRHFGAQRMVIAILLACPVTALPSLHAVQARTLHASAVQSDIPQSRTPTNRLASHSTAPVSVDLGEDVDPRGLTDRPVTSSRAPRVLGSRSVPVSAVAAPVRDQSQILRI